MTGPCDGCAALAALVAEKEAVIVAAQKHFGCICPQSASCKGYCSDADRCDTVTKPITPSSAKSILEARDREIRAGAFEEAAEQADKLNGPYGSSELCASHLKRIFREKAAALRGEGAK